MDSKPWWQSKAVWAGVITILVAAWNAGVNSVFALPAIPDWVYPILGALGVYGRVNATTTVK